MSFYACFDIDSGQVIKGTNELQTSAEFLEIEKDMYVRFIQNELSINDYVIVPTASPLEKYKIVEKEKVGTVDLTNKSIVPITEAKYDKEIQNIFYLIHKQNKWKGYANLSFEYKNYISKSPTYKDFVKRFYITEKHNPYRLLDVLDVPMKKFLNKRQFVIKSAKYQTPISIFTIVAHDKFIQVMEE